MCIWISRHWKGTSEIEEKFLPLDAYIELWQVPDNTQTKMRVYIEDGNKRLFSTIIETPRGPNTVDICNIGHLELPLAAGVVADYTVIGPVVSAPENL